MKNKTTKFIIEEISKSLKEFHILVDFPTQKRKEIAEAIDSAFGDTIRITSPNIHWKTIFNDAHQIKIIDRAAQITNRHGLEEYFFRMLKDKKTYLLFSDDSIRNAKHQRQWLNFVEKEEAHFQLYEYPHLFPENPEIQPHEINLIKEKGEKWCKRIPLALSALIFLFAMLAYYCAEILKIEYLKKWGKIGIAMGIIGSFLNYLNFLFDFNIFDFLKKWGFPYMCNFCQKWAYVILKKKPAPTKK